MDLSILLHEDQISEALHNYFRINGDFPINDISWVPIMNSQIFSSQSPQLVTRISYFINVNINGVSAASCFLKIEYAHPKIVGAASKEFRRGLEYEAFIYKSLLNPYGLVLAPRHIASWICEQDCSYAFLMSCIEDAQPIHYVGYKEGLVNAAKWLGSFHRKCEQVFIDFPSETRIIPRLSDDSYRTWLESAIPCTGKYKQIDPILSEYPRHIDALVDTLAAAPASLVHGDFYPPNILLNSSGEVIPIDWEAASVGTELLDLGSLTEFWSSEAVDLCLTIYQQTRWTDLPPCSFRLIFQACRIYYLAKYLGSLDTTSNRGLSSSRALSDALRYFREELNSG